jgi:hypothetical protein
MYHIHGNLLRQTRWYFWVILVKWKLILVNLDIVLISRQGRCTVRVKCTIRLFGDSVNLDARWVHGLRRMYHRHGNHIGRTQWNSKVTWVKWKLILG